MRALWLADDFKLTLIKANSVIFGIIGRYANKKPLTPGEVDFAKQKTERAREKMPFSCFLRIYMVK